MEKFNKSQYDAEYRKKYYKSFNCALRIEEHEEVTKILKENNMNKVDLIRWAINELKNK